MAFGAKRVFPNDLRPRVAIGVDIPFNGDAVFRSNYQTKNAIKNNLINFLLTNPGERIANPNFGAGLRAYIFEQIVEDDLSFIQEDIQTKINENFNNITLQNVEVTSQPDRNIIQVNITYSVPNTDINDQLELRFS
jgi:phage baseplate assembly protein W